MGLKSEHFGYKAIHQKGVKSTSKQKHFLPNVLVYESGLKKLQIKSFKIFN